MQRKADEITDLLEFEDRPIREESRKKMGNEVQIMEKDKGRLRGGDKEEPGSWGEG